MLAPLFLLGLLGIGLPVFIHRLHERRAEVQPFPSSRLLEETRRTTTRRRRIRFRWLLATRILMLAVLCLLFAQPLLRFASGLLDQSDQIHLFVIDDSYSMRHGERWQQSLDLASAQLDSQSDSTVITVQRASGIVGDNSINDSLSGNSENSDTVNISRHEDARAELERLRASTPTNYPVSYADVMDRAQRFANKQNEPVFVHIFSDMQRSAAADGINRLFREGIANVTLHPVGKRSDHNVALDAQIVWLDSVTARIDAQVLLALADADASDGLTAGIETDDSSTDSSSHRVEVVVSTDDNTVLARTAVDLHPTRLTQVQMQLDALDDVVRARQQAASGDGPVMDLVVEVQGEVVSSDQLPDDNRVLLGLPENSPARIAVLPMDPANQQRDLAYLQSAFRQMHNHQLVELDSRANAIEEDVALLFVLNRSGQVSVPAPAVEFFKRGGPVVQVLAGSAITPGPVTGISQTNEINDTNALYSTYSGVDRIVAVDPVHPLALQRSAWSSVTLNRPLWQSADLRAIANAISTLVSDNQINNVAIDQPVDIESVFSDVADVLISSESGTPLLLQPRISSSTASSSVARRSIPLLVLLAPLDGISSNLPVHPVFISFLQSLSAHMLESGRYPTQLYSGDSLILNRNNQLLTPGQQPVYDLATIGDTRTHVLDAIGTYTVLEPRRSHLIQVGIDPAESDIEMFSTSSIESWQQQYAAGSDQIAVSGDVAARSSDAAVEESSQGATDAAPTDNVRDIPLWQWLLPILVIMLLLESLLANRAFSRFSVKGV